MAGGWINIHLTVLITYHPTDEQEHLLFFLLQPCHGAVVGDQLFSSSLEQSLKHEYVCGEKLVYYYKRETV